jgi:hypothetical protein
VQFARIQGIVPWLKAIGVIPNDVTSVKPSQVKLELDPKAINGGYLASVAYEWDSWGESTPPDFIRALRCELKGSPERDTIANALLSLGRSLNAEWT